MERKNVVKELTIIFWLFIIGSVLGYIFEMIVVLFQNGCFESRQGLIYGPFTPVYGMGVIIYYVMLKNFKTKDKVKVFLATAVLGGVTEYLCSVLQEKLFGTVSWDYSNLIFNINGRTSLLHCTYWGIAGILYIVYIEPILERVKQVEDKLVFKVITIVLFIFLIFDISISWLAANRQFARRNAIPATNALDLFLDKYYPDEYMDEIYANKKEIV